MHAIRGVGLRPLSPVHVRGRRTGGTIEISWVRRTRVGGDSWDLVEVPLGEASEAYAVDILDGATLKRTIATSVPSATYGAAEQIADFGSAQPAYSIRVCQLSASAGRGTQRQATV